jgi:hypothetical protein
VNSRIDRISSEFASISGFNGFFRSIQPQCTLTSPSDGLWNVLVARAYPSRQTIRALFKS